MIRAVVEKGWLKPLDPLPASLHEGREVVVAVLDDNRDFSTAEIDDWYKRTNELAAKSDPSEDDALMAELERLRAEQKGIMRQKMGLP